VVDRENDRNGRVLRVLGFQEGFHLDFTIAKVSHARDHLPFSWALRSESFSRFKINKVEGARTDYSAIAGHIGEIIALASDKYLYNFQYDAPVTRRGLINKFLRSMRVNNERLYAETATEKDHPGPETDEREEEVISLEKVVSNPEVLAAYERKYAKREIKITSEPMSAFKKGPSFENGIRRAIGLDKPDFFFKTPIAPTPYYENFKLFYALVKVNLLANGEIGDITVYSDAIPDFTKACVNTVRKAKFIPAYAYGKNIDMVYTDECLTMEAYVRRRDMIPY
jgi:hypothetical protein